MTRVSDERGVLRRKRTDQTLQRTQSRGRLRMSARGANRWPSLVAMLLDCVEVSRGLRSGLLVERLRNAQPNVYKSERGISQVVNVVISLFFLLDSRQGDRVQDYSLSAHTVLAASIMWMLHTPRPQWDERKQPIQEETPSWEILKVKYIDTIQILSPCIYTISQILLSHCTK
jgi:hypothetical protein